MSVLSKLLEKILGENCQEEIDIFTREKIDIDLFYELDKATLKEMGKIFYFYFVILLFCYHILFHDNREMNDYSDLALSPAYGMQ